MLIQDVPGLVLDLSLVNDSTVDVRNCPGAQVSGRGTAALKMTGYLR